MKKEISDKDLIIFGKKVDPKSEIFTLYQKWVDEGMDMKSPIRNEIQEIINGVGKPIVFTFRDEKGYQVPDPFMPAPDDLLSHDQKCRRLNIF